MASAGFAPVTAGDLGRVQRILLAARVFTEETELLATLAHSPWRVQVTPGGDLVVLDRWRDHLDLLAIEALWCSERRIPEAVSQLRDVADALGYGDLLSPPVPLDQVYAYEAAGMRVRETASSWILDPRHGVTAASAAACDAELRPGGPGDLAQVIDIDSRSFDAFWRYDRRRLERFLRSQQLIVAEGDAGPIGYTLCTVDRGDGGLGRLCVVPTARRRGVGGALVAEAVRRVAEAGASRLVLCTQVDNVPARALYRSMGFRETGGRFAFLQFD